MAQKACMRWGSQWRNLANTTEPCMCDGDTAFLLNYFDHSLLLLIGIYGCLRTNLCITSGIFCVSGIYGTPRRFGKISGLEKFDASFFGLDPKDAARTDPQIRVLTEVAYEAMIDAG